MDQRERANPYEEAIRAAMDGRQAAIWTCLPGIVESFNPVAMTAEVQPAIQAVRRLPNGSTELVTLPLLLDCPVEFPSGGGVTITFPVAKGDECEVVFASRCIDGWWQNGGVQPQAEMRMHDLSDGFVRIGPRSKPRALSSISTVTAQFRSDTGETFVELDAVNHKVNITAPGGATITANTTITGNLHVTGTITGDTDVVTGSISLKNHHHTGVTTGSGSTGGPT